MRVAVLGPAEVSRDGTPVDLGTRKQRALLAALALHRGRAVHVDTLVDLLWADRPPPGVAGTLQAYVAGLRRALEPERVARTPSRVLVTVAPGYALHLPDEALDVTRFEAAVSSAHQTVAPLAAAPAGAGTSVAADDLRQTVADLDAVLRLWRGTPFLELDDAPAAVAERVRLEELRLVALEDRATAGLALGRHATVAAELEGLTSAHPLRERLWALRALALTRSGRQAEALDALQQVRALLTEELGIEPGAELRALQQAILRQDPSLDLPAAVPEAPTVGDAPTGPSTPAPAASTMTVPAPAPAPAPTTPRRELLPLIGRDHELAALTRMLDEADAGTPSFAALVGDPGMGKSRLAGEVAALATERGAQVLVGRCSQDEGAPPLWPWSSVLAGLGQSLPVEAGTADESTRFRAWDDLCDALLRASRDRTTLVVLDDLHWADVSSLRVLGLLLEKAQDAHLAVLATWRDRPPPTGPLAAVADGMARRHAARLALTGLSADDVAEVVRAVAATTATAEEAADLRSRTDGNPFFLVEFARLVCDGGGLGAVLAEPHPPAAVSDVLARRLERLPEETVRLLRTAAVVGRDFDLTTVSAVAGLDDLAALDGLEPAVAAGLVLDVGDDRFRFAHALVRDHVYSSQTPSRRSRVHALVAEALEGVPDRQTEVARHWSAAGPGSAARAWRAARDAAEQACVVYAYDEAEELLRTAVRLLDDDAEASTLDEYDVLMGLARTLRLAGKWLDLRRVVHRLIELADWIGDVELLARAAVLPSNGALWQAAAHGHVDEPTADALRRALAALPPEDHPLRCRAMLSLASEIYYGVSAQEREALAEQGLAMARRIGDPTLLLSACQIAFVSTWRPETAPSRLALAEEAVALAQQLDDESALTSTLTVRAVVAGEVGDVTTMTRLSTEARRRAEHHRQLYSLVVLDSLDVSWAALRGQWEQAEHLIAHLAATGEKMSLPQYADALAGAMLVVGIWQERYVELLPLIRSREENSSLPIVPVVVMLLLRAGLVEEARTHLAEHPVELDADTWFSMVPWSLACEIGLTLGDRTLCGDAYARLAPFAGRSCCAGSGVAMGPVDGFLALAAAGVGDRDLAARHADDALDLCRTWEIPLAERWLLGQRDRFGF